jgi:hypothetical protein
MMMSKVADFCFGTTMGSKKDEEVIILIKNGVNGYFNYYEGDVRGHKDDMRKEVDRLNEEIGVSKSVAMAMKNGSMFGWHTPSANPNNYNEDGTFKKDVI